MSETDTQGEPRVEVWVRNSAPYGATPAQEAVCEQLRRLEDRGEIAGFSTAAWGSRIDATAPGAMSEYVRPAREKLAEFEAWASQHGYTLHPAFETREISPRIVDATREVIVPPIVCLAVYDGDALRGVFPHSDGTATHTVDGCLDRLGAAADRSGTDEPGIVTE